MGAADRRLLSVGAEDAEQIPQPGDAVLHPVAGPVRDHHAAALQGRIACGIAVGAVAVDVAFKARLIPVEGLQHIQGILDGNHAVGTRGEEEAGAGLLIDHLGNAGDVDADLQRGLAPEDRIAEDGGVGAVLGHDRRRAGQVPAGGKADDGDLVRYHMPFLRPRADHGHGLLVILQGPRPAEMLPCGIAQNEGLKARLQIGHGHRLGLAV